MSFWYPILIGLCVCLAAFVCWKEWMRPNKARIAWRLLASLLAIAAFAGFILPITRKVTITEDKSAPQALLITKGFNPDSVGRLLNTMGPTAVVWVSDPSLASVAKNFHPRVIGAADWVAASSGFSTIHVAGYGPGAEVLQALPAARCVFHPSAPPDGIAAAQWPKKIKAGEPFVVQGYFLNTSTAAVRVVLRGYDTDLDTAMVPANSRSPFALRCTPKQLGKALFSLRVIGNEKSAEEEPLPFEVEQPGTLKIFLLSSSPDFETKFLKRWLSQNSYALVTKTTISKDKYEQTFTNTPRTSFSTLTPTLLRDFDVLIADQDALAELSRAELAAVESQLAQRGMGLIVRSSDSSRGRMQFYDRPFPITQDPGQNQKMLQLSVAGGSEATAALAVDRPVYIRPQPGTQELVTDKEAHQLAGSSLYGAGRLIYTTLNNTATWMLSGNSSAYQAFWSCLLNKAAAPTEATASWTVTTGFPRVNTAVDLQYAGNRPEDQRVQIGQDFVYLAQHPGLPFQWQASYWPEREGWQPVMMDGTTCWWYAYGPDSWKTIAAVQQIEQTRRMLPAIGQAQPKTNNEIKQAEVPVSKTIFLAVFFLSMAFLWLEKKL